jgi:tripartite-type tricarboxylate transporter receptor subunit TctC
MLARLSAGTVFVACLAASVPAHPAESYPAKPVRLIVASGPGGGLDFVARLIAPTLTGSMGRSIVVDNRPGATGAIAAELTARAAPDGYTLMMLSASLIVYEAVAKTGYDLFRDFAAICQVTAAPYLLVVHPRLPVKSVADLIVYAKAHPGELNYFSTGNASFVHLTTEWFRVLTGITLVHVPYKGLGAVLPDLLSGRLHMGFGSPASVMPHLHSGALRPLAITSAARSALLPHVPTMIEAGVPGFLVSQWIGAVAPRGTPPAIIQHLHGEFVAAIRQPENLASLHKQGLDPVGSTPAEFGALMKSEFATWSRVVKQAGIRGET